MGITLRQLEYFVAVVDAGSITRAAELLHVTPTAVSLQIRLLEDLVGISLLTRHSRGIVPTKAGVDLLTQAAQILDMVLNMEKAFMQTEPEGRIIRLGAPPAFSRLIGIEAIQGAAKWLGTPNLHLVEGWTHELERRLARQELDCLIGWDLPRSPEIYITPLIEDRFIFACAPSLAGDTAAISLNEALASPLVFYGENSVSWRISQEAARFAGVKLASERHVESIAVWRNLLCRGLGTAIVSTRAIAEECARGELTVRKISGYSAKRMIEVAVHVEDRAEPWALAISDFLKDLVLAAQPRISSKEAPPDVVSYG